MKTRSTLKSLRYRALDRSAWTAKAGWRGGVGLAWLLTMLLISLALACPFVLNGALLSTMVVGDKSSAKDLGTERNETAGHPLSPNDALSLVRIQYDSTGGYGESWYRHDGRDWQRWETDFPQAEENLLFRLNQLTSFRVNPEPLVLRLTDERLFDYPFIFMSDVGWQSLSMDEAHALSEYLLRGGFLWVDDFWGDAELNNLLDNTAKMPGSWRWSTLPDDHPMLTTVYPLEACPRIPARIFYRSTGRDYDPPEIHRWPAGGDAGVRTVHLLGLHDPHGRLVAIATHNTDIADGWEREGEDREFFLRFSVQSYAFSINVITYALTN